jgi:hypothetical protein
VAPGLAPDQIFCVLFLERMVDKEPGLTSAFAYAPSSFGTRTETLSTGNQLGIQTPDARFKLLA